MKKYLAPMLGILVLVLISRYVFERLNLYYELWWLDIVMHLVVGALLGALIQRISYVHEKGIAYAIGVFIVVATVWEIYEYMRGVLDDDMYTVVIDTTIDYALGLLGFIVGYTRKVMI